MGFFSGLGRAAGRAVANAEGGLNKYQLEAYEADLGRRIRLGGDVQILHSIVLFELIQTTTLQKM